VRRRIDRIRDSCREAVRTADANGERVGRAREHSALLDAVRERLEHPRAGRLARRLGYGTLNARTRRRSVRVQHPDSAARLDVCQCEPPR
jgi:hypothetical protein